MRVGIMGGTFDPPHLGHTLPAKAAADEFELDVVWFVPAYIPPHKKRDILTDPYQRAAMVALAIQPYDHFCFSSEELHSGVVRYTNDTIATWKRRLKSRDKLFFLMGSDSFLEIHTWHAYRQLLRRCDFIIMNRGAQTRELKRKLQKLEVDLEMDLKKTVHFASAAPLSISSTQIRTALRQGKSVSGMLAPEVEAFIHKQSLYQRR